ncbi:MAG: OadG family protein [Bacteroidia bacterium]
MSKELAEALQLLVVGMGTVFIILALVVFMGRQLIGVVNRWMPLAEKASSSSSSSLSSAIQPDILAAIVSAVDVVTDGKGKVDHVERID